MAVLQSGRDDWFDGEGGATGQKADPTQADQGGFTLETFLVQFGLVWFSLAQLGLVKFGLAYLIFFLA